MSRYLLMQLLCLFGASLFGQAVSEYIKVDQFGYLQQSSKIALISNPITGYNNCDCFSPATTYELRRSSDNVSVFSAALTSWNSGATHVQSGDKVWWFDFSSYTTPGTYYVYDPTNDVRSFFFEIENSVYDDVLKAAVRTFYYQRCNSAKVAPYAETGWTDGNNFVGTEQDADCRLVSNPIASTSKDLTGGWFDAGDYNKYMNFADGVVHNLLDAYDQNKDIWTDDYNIPESGNGIPDILDEIKWELDWMLKMQESNGSALHKISNTTFNAASPPSSDTEVRRYAPATVSATASLCSAVAHAAIIYKASSNVSLQTYGQTLETAAINAWNWLDANPGTSSYNNAGFVNVAAEDPAYNQEANKFAAAVYLFAITNDNTYKTYVDANWANLHLKQWTFAYVFEAEYQDAALYYAALANATTSIADDIKATYLSTITNSAENMPAITANTDAYRAYLKDDNHVWGSNGFRMDKANMFYNMVYYNLNPSSSALYTATANGYLHYLHGTNPTGMVYLTNMNSLGAENSANEIYHNWFADGSTLWDRVGTSTYGPPPGFVTGGPNPSFVPDGSYTGPAIEPPMNQPIQKSYDDWNTSFPQNSWQITENAIYYQAKYIKFLSKSLTPSALPIELLKFDVSLTQKDQALLQWHAVVFSGTDHFEIERSKDGSKFESIGQHSAKPGSNAIWHSFLDTRPLAGINYYRIKTVNQDGTFSYSPIKSIDVPSIEFNMSPNPFQDQLRVEFEKRPEGQASYQFTDVKGQVLDAGIINEEGIINPKSLAPGAYFITIEVEGKRYSKKVWYKD